MEKVAMLEEKASRYGVNTLESFELISLATGMNLSKVRKMFNASRSIKDTLLNACELKALAVFELCKRAYMEDIKYEYLDSLEKIGKYCVAQLSHEKEEVFWVLYMDAQDRLLASKEINRGTLRSTLVYVRKVIWHALTLRCTKIILAHNHPSGSKHPSKDDVEFTDNLVQAASLFDLFLVDHIIVYGNNYTSMERRQYIKRSNN